MIKELLKAIAQTIVFIAAFAVIAFISMLFPILIMHAMYVQGM